MRLIIAYQKLSANQIFKIVEKANEIKHKFCLNFDIFNEILEKYKPNRLGEVEHIYLNVILAKKDLYNFYIKYGYEDTNHRENLEKALKDITIFVKSEFALLRKKLN
jgi:hypothetical protein